MIKMISSKCLLDTGHFLNILPILIYLNIHSLFGEGVYHNLLWYKSPFSLVAQTVKHLPAMWETLVRSLGWEDPLEEEMATHFSTLAWESQTWLSNLKKKSVYIGGYLDNTVWWQSHNSLIFPLTLIALLSMFSKAWHFETWVNKVVASRFRVLD